MIFLKHRLLLEGAVFTIVAAAIAHLCYSWIGFNPTDEGYMLSGSRRLLSGQIPHRDYISLRPVGTHLLHAHFLYWGGDHLIWWSRFSFWFEIALTSWCWILIARKICRDIFISSWIRLALGSIAFVASSGNFPMMPWNTVDGLLFISAGIAIVLYRPEKAWIGALAIGASPLFRQNFIFPLPFLLLALGQARSFQSWIAAALPSFLYGAFLVAAGALPDALVQMGSHGGSLADALLPVHTFTVAFLGGLLFGGLGVGLIVKANIHDEANQPLNIAGGALLGIGFIYAALIIPYGDSIRSTGWFLFGMLLVASPFLVRSHRPSVKLVMLALITAWGASISEGCPQPALICGALFIVLAAVMVELQAPLFRIFVALSLVTALFAFHRARVIVVNADRQADLLTYELSDAMPGAYKIFTNSNTHAFMKDLTSITTKLRSEGRRYGVVPEAPQFWVTDPQLNPLSSDWPIDAELRDARLMNRVLGEINASHGKFTFVVQKYQAVYIPTERRAITESKVVAKVKADFRKVAETEFFEIYE